tara:strand:- start:1091 stop:3613 length:2523 start_codon:yes stop_codon:yes gene_type:complete
MGNGLFNINGNWKNLQEWYVRTDPTAPVLEFDGSNEPKDLDSDIKSYIQSNYNVTGYDFTNIPQGNTVILPEFTLTDKFKIEFRIYGKSTTNNEVACIFSTQHDRQGVFSDSVFAMYPPTLGDGFPSDACAIHVVPKNDPAANPHRQFIISGDGTTVDQQARFGGRRVVFRGLFDNAWHNVRVEYDGSTSSNATLDVYIDNDDGNFVKKDLYRNSSSMSAGTNKQTTVPHGDGFTASHSARLMSSYAYNSAYINTNGFNSHNNSTPRFNAHSGKLGNFKLTLYPNGVEAVHFDYALKDGVQTTDEQLVHDRSGFTRHGTIIKASDLNFEDLWDYGDGTTASWKQIEEAYVKEAGIWRCIFNGKIIRSISGVVADYDIFTQFGNPNVAIDMELYIDTGAIVYSTSTSHGAIYTSSPLPAGSTLRITNRGTVYGKGGDGGDCPYNTGNMTMKEVDRNNCESGDGHGLSDFKKVPLSITLSGSGSDVTDGGAGGSALELPCNTVLLNNGNFHGGGGGGGANRIWNVAWKDDSPGRPYILDGTISGGGGAGYQGGQGGQITKKASSHVWSRPSHRLNSFGTAWGAGSTDIFRAETGSVNGGGTGLRGYSRRVSSSNSKIWDYCAGGNLDQDGLCRISDPVYVNRSFGFLYRYSSLGGRRGAGIDTKGFTLTYDDRNTRTVDNVFDTVTGVGVPTVVAAGKTPVKAKKGDRFFGTCVLGTACFYQDLITEKELLGLVKWRMKKQKHSFLSEQVWLGYMVGYRWLAQQMLKSKTLARFIHKIIVKDWVRKSKGECNMYLRSFIICSYAVIIFYLKPKACITLRDSLPKTARGVLSFYKKVINAKDF